MHPYWILLGGIVGFGIVRNRYFPKVELGNKFNFTPVVSERFAECGLTVGLMDEALQSLGQPGLFENVRFRCELQYQFFRQTAFIGYETENTLPMTFDLFPTMLEIRMGDMEWGYDEAFIMQHHEHVVGNIKIILASRVCKRLRVTWLGRKTEYQFFDVNGTLIMNPSDMAMFDYQRIPKQARETWYEPIFPTEQVLTFPFIQKT